MEYIILIISLVGIVFGADFLVAGAVSIARKYKVSDFVIGAAIVGVGTSMPELVVSFIGALQGNADVAIGNVVGSNIFNVLGILGLTAVFFPVAVDKANMKFEIPLCIIASVLLTVLAMNFFDGTSACIGRIDGLVLLCMFVFFMWYSFYRDRKSPSASQEEQVQEDKTPLWLAIVKVVGGLALLITSCDSFVDNAVLIAKSFGVNDAFISLTLIACGTSLPELVTAVTSLLKGRGALSLGNLIGANLFNLALVSGMAISISPFAVPVGKMIGSMNASLVMDIPVMLTVMAILTIPAILRNKLSKVQGFALLAIYATFVTLQFVL